MQTTVTEKDICRGLKKLGITCGMSVEVFDLGVIRTEKIGDCNCMVLPVQTVVNLYKQELIKDAWGLYGLEKSVE